MSSHKFNKKVFKNLLFKKDYFKNLLLAEKMWRLQNSEQHPNTIGKCCSLPGQLMDGGRKARGRGAGLVESNFLGSEPEVSAALTRSGLQTHFLLLARPQAPTLQSNLHTEAALSKVTPHLLPSTQGTGPCPSHFGPAPLCDPRGNSGRTLRYSGPVRAFTTEISEEWGWG